MANYHRTRSIVGSGLSPPPPPPPPVSIPDPRAYYTFDSTRNDSSGNGFNLTGLVNYAAAKYGNGARSAEGMSRANDILAGPNAGYTIAFWFDNTTVLRRFDVACEGFVSLRGGPETAVTATLAPMLPEEVVLSDAGTGAGSGYSHIALTVASDLATLYRDGVAVDSAPWASPGDFAGTENWLWLSAGFQATSSYVDDGAIWDQVLTAEQVAAIAGAAGALSTLL